jgi:hypothetical protein
MCCLNINNICAKSNDTLLTLQLLERIQTLQMSSDGVFPKGTFPTYRTYALNKDRQKNPPPPKMNVFSEFEIILMSFNMFSNF